MGIIKSTEELNAPAGESAITSSSISENILKDATEKPSDIINSSQVQSVLNSLIDAVKKGTDESEELKKGFVKLKDEQANFKSEIYKDIQSGKERVTETLAIFVGLFTFISINFSFLSNKELSFPNFLSYDLLIGGFLLLFVYLVRLFIHDSDEYKKNEWILVISALFLIALGSYWGSVSK